MMDKNIDFSKTINVASALHLLKKCFLSMVTSKNLIKKVLYLDIFQPLSPVVQDKILDATINNTIAEKFPPSISYRRYFLKIVLEGVEQCSCEASERLLLAYTDLLCKASDESVCFFNYLLNEIDFITIQENPSLVINSTTGLRTWEASKFLSEWCLENTCHLKNRKILELGSGVGLLGIAVSKICQPSSYTFTDNSSDVLRILPLNIALNLFHAEARDSSSNEENICKAGESNHVPPVCENSSSQFHIEAKYDKCSYHEHEIPSNQKHQLIHTLPQKNNESIFKDVSYKDIQMWNLQPKIDILYLDWGSITNEEATHLLPEIILAADVTYDPFAIPHLVHALYTFLSAGVSYAYVSCAIRNSETYQCFCNELDSSNLASEILQSPKETIFFYDRTSHFKIHKVFIK